MRILEEVGLDFDDVLLIPKRSELISRADAELKREFKFKHSPLSLSCIPIIAANLDTVGTLRMANALKQKGMLTALHKFNDNGAIAKSILEGDDFSFYTMGTTLKDFDKLRDYIDNYGIPLLVCVDVANGYSQAFVEHVQKVRDWCKHSMIMAGNVVTPEMTEELILKGVDVVKVGISCGGQCLTKNKTGVGYPQFSAIMNCADAAHGVGGLICGDGGCKEPGDIAKAFGAGADFVMIGSMLAGTDECEGEWEYTGGKWYSYCKHRILGNGSTVAVNNMGGVYIEIDDPDLDKQIIEPPTKARLRVYGMSSKEAMAKHGGSEKTYRASEGACGWVDYQGPVSGVADDILGGLRSAMTYIGAKRIKDVPKCTTFIRKA